VLRAEVTGVSERNISFVTWKGSKSWGLLGCDAV